MTIQYTPEDVAGGFAGAVTFSREAAAAVAKRINAAGDLGSMDPDDAARAVQAAVAGEGQNVSIDLSLAALTAIHARKGAEGVVVGFTDQPGAARASSGGGADVATSGAGGSGTAAAAGPGSQGAGAGADTQADASPASARTRKLTGAAKAAADRKAAKAAGGS